MPDSAENPIPDRSCPTHGQPAKWLCPVCGQPVCSACKPVGWNYRVYHVGCLAAARNQVEHREEAARPVDGPSLGVRLSGYYLVVKAIVFLALFLLLEGLALFGKSVPLRAVMTTPIPMGLDAIPGGRSFVVWMGVFSLGFAVLWFVLGIGLLNCLRMARLLVLWIAGIDILLAGLVWLVILASGEGLWTVPVVSLVFLVYFLRPGVKSQFA